MKPLTYRDDRKRYPRWVKAVEQPTTQFDLEKSDLAAPPLGLMGNPEYFQKVNVGWEPLGRQIASGAPGRSLRDSALHWGFSTYFTRSLHPAGGAKLSTTPVHQLLRAHVPTPEQLGIERWQGSEQEASAMVEHAAIQFGAAQVGFAALEPKWLYDNARIVGLSEGAAWQTFYRIPRGVIPAKDACLQVNDILNSALRRYRATGGKG